MRARFCPTCGRALSPPGVPEIAVAVPQRVQLEDEMLDLRALINVVESGVRYWQQQLASADTVTREQAASALEDLSKILHSLSQQIALGRTSVRITSRLPALRSYGHGCPACGQGNRSGAKFCQRCGTLLSGALAKEPTMLAPPPLRFQIAARSDIGRMRRINQDMVATAELPLADGSVAQLCLVADGMGGAKAGELASSIAAAQVAQQLSQAIGRAPATDAAWEEALRSAALAANKAVYRESRADPDHQGMGTTLTVALIHGQRLYLASVGDTRAYLINARGVTVDDARVAQLTSDHSLVARLVDIGQITAEQARTHPQRNMLYRSIGTDPSVEVDTRTEQIDAGDVILLCSDGLFGHVRDDELARVVIEQDNPERACITLIDLANRRGGSDNISVVIIRVER
ncbi:MAG: Stp1/IreP family PP2C-type Ser/Thr phosphatase [Roseiflexaceae bacterium]|nr:Stp1/IreP family PP2C-type Ser/Thr phosphatase [Roseiflexaceae bacterium]